MQTGLAGMERKEFTRVLWHELTIIATEPSQEMVSHYLYELGAAGVSVEESWSTDKPRDTSLGQWYDKPLNDIRPGYAEIKGYFAEETDLEKVTKELRALLAGLPEFGYDAGDFTISAAQVQDEDWADAWKKYFKPLQVSERLTIKPTWETYEPREDEIVIELDPGMAFGTGTHPTTALCLRALESAIRGGETLIDVGTGSGILAIGAVKLGASRVLALDLDPIAVSSATENIELNGLQDVIEVRRSDLLGILSEGDIGGERGETDELSDEDSSGKRGEACDLSEGDIDGIQVDTSVLSEGDIGETNGLSRALSERDIGPLSVRPPVDIVVANILAEIILLFTADVAKVLKPGGIYIASGIYKNKEADVEAGLLAAGFEIVDRVRQDDWLAFVAGKPKEDDEDA